MLLLGAKLCSLSRATIAPLTAVLVPDRVWPDNDDGLAARIRKTREAARNRLYNRNTNREGNI
jgi:hypothetical protein